MKHVPRDSLPKAVHSKFRKSFDSLHEAGLFLYDTVQAGGKRLSRTFVTRTLLGDPGITYKVRARGMRSKGTCWTDEAPERCVCFCVILCGVLCVGVHALCCEKFALCFHSILDWSAGGDDGLISTWY